MRIVALLAARNEALYLPRCLDHLHNQGIETCVIDNDSTGATREIAESFRGRGVFHVEHAPYAGQLDLVGLLTLKQRLAKEISADWFIHHDADEIRETPMPGVTLSQAISQVDADGCNAIDFDEFVFLPPDTTANFEGRHYVREMQSYYYFAPRALHRVNAWRRTDDLDLVSSAGHRAEFAGRRIFRRNFLLRHYIVLSVAHAERKYGVERVYNERETTERGWRPERLKWRHGKFELPPVEKLKWLGAGPLDRSDPQRAHLFKFTERALS